MRKIKNPKQFNLTAALKVAVTETASASDRAAALTLAAIIDDQVHAIVRKRLLVGLHGRSGLFDFSSAPLGTPFARNAFLYETGAISAVLHRDLELIRRIRNLFAHEWSITSFDDPRIRGLVDVLHPEDKSVASRSRDRRRRLNLPIDQPIYADADFGCRGRFGLAVIVLIIILASIRKSSKKPRKVRPEADYGKGAFSKLDSVTVILDYEEAGLNPRKSDGKSRRRVKRSNAH